MPSDAAVPKQECFFITPIGSEGSPERRNADTVVKYLVRAALPAFDVSRADDETSPDAITPRIVRSILSANLIVVDITGRNPNVFYELAIAHGYRKPTVHIAKKGERPPFDIQDMRILFYDTSDPEALEMAVNALEASAETALKNPADLHTPLQGAQQFERAVSSGDPVAETNAQIMEMLTNLQNAVKQLSESRPTPRVYRTGQNPDHAESYERALQFIEDRDSLPASVATGIGNGMQHAAYVNNLEKRAQELTRELHDPITMTQLALGGTRRVAIEAELEEVRDKLRLHHPTSGYL